MLLLRAFKINYSKHSFSLEQNMKIQQMAKRYDYSNEKQDASNSNDEEEALSLCDLPINLLATKGHQSINNDEANGPSGLQEEEDFNFSSLDISHSVEQEQQMCVADDVFFKGKILPLRLSASSDTGSARFPQSSVPPSRRNSGSESIDYRRSPSIGFTSNSSRSSSSKSSHNSGSSSTKMISCNTPSKRAPSKPIIRNQFHAHPSPTPQIKISGTRHGNAGSRSWKSSSMWDFFRVGLVRTPKIELHDLKARTNNTNKKHINKSFGSRNSSSISNEGNANQRLISTKKDEKRRRFFDKDGKGLFNGCKCSADVIETATSKIVIMKSNSAAINGNNYEKKTHQALKEKLQIIKQQKQRQQVKHHQQQDGREALSHHRTCEWLKELSISGGHEEV